jgi:hypothetical protein
MLLNTVLLRVLRPVVAGSTTTVVGGPKTTVIAERKKDPHRERRGSSGEVRLVGWCEVYGLNRP